MHLQEDFTRRHGAMVVALLEEVKGSYYLVVG